ncbi:Flap endonuclease GEN like protein 1 [Fukomys damarensis]|uniref:Flap endonuclease GEN like protein 1 n=1 Tax=Fukomys damarensis TaxID=885580 RepID=A0A091CWP6_FUKDA|nr:Flap endonuclease GEN like protein 1 [Fukomys damarensis]
MGVNDLWQILEPVKQHVHLRNLCGKTIAVDLSLWVCEAQSVKKMMGTVVKPHLRNLFFRVSYLMQMDIKLVFVMEGEPPNLKADVMNKRNHMRYGASGKTWSQKTGRSHFKSVLREPQVAKLAHCSVCSHPGSLKDHEHNGCQLCKSNRYCEPHDYEYCCPCEWHQTEHDRQLNGVENNIKKIVKPRIRNGVHCFEVEWEMPEHFAIEDEELILTVEEESLFEAAYPKIVAIYKKQNLETKGKKQKHMKIKPKEDSFPKSDDAAVDLQSLVTLKPTPENFPKQDSKLNLEISSDPVLPQKTISGSLTSLLLPQDVSCLNMQEELMSSSRPLLSQHSKDASNSLSLKSGQPNPSLHDTSVITDLHLSSIDWEGTSFSNYPAIQGSATFNDLQSEFESKLLVTPGNFENTPGQLLCESGWCTANINKLSEGHLQKISPEKHLLSGISDLYLQDLPLKERIYMKSSYPEDNAQSDVDLKTLPLQKIKESYIANSRSDCPSHLSKDLPGINLLNESRNSEVTKRDQLPQENCKVNTSVLYSVNSSKIVKTSSVQAGPPNNSSGHSRKVDMHTIQKRVKKNSVCLHRHSSDAESSPVFDKVKNTTQKIKHSSQEHNLAQFKESDHNKQRNPTIHAKETTLSVKSYRTTGNEEKHFSDPAKSSMSFLQCHKKDDDLGTCLDSPLPLCQRLKLRFQST